ncbi:MAG: hypothetical protein E6Q96_04815, partial [Cyclobacteriaceae bacterium]
MQLLAIFFISLITLVHPLHISVTEITLDEKENELEIMMRVFTDDLEAAIRNEKNNPDLSLVNPRNTTLDKIAWEYIQTKFKLAADGDQLSLKYLGHE